MATTTLESTPPLMYDTTGTSARSRRFTLASSTSSNSSVSVFVVGGVFLPRIGEIESPVGVLADAGRLAVAAELNLQVVAGRQRLDALETGDGAGHREEGEQVVDAARVGPRLHHAGGEKRLDLRGEQQPFAVRRGLPGPVERTDAEAVAAEDDAPPLLVPQGDGELAAEVVEHPFLVVFPAVRDDFGVAVGGEAMAAAFQRRLLFRVVEQLAVEDDGDGAVFVEDGLPAVGQADDAEAARGEGQAGPFQVAVLVRPAVDDGVGHRPDRPRGDRPPLSGKVKDSRDAAHQIVLCKFTWRAGGVSPLILV